MQEPSGEWVHIVLWALGGLMTLIVLIGSAYMRRLGGDIQALRADYQKSLGSITANCGAESIRHSNLAERTAKLEATAEGMVKDLEYIRNRIDEMMTFMTSNRESPKWNSRS